MRVSPRNPDVVVRGNRKGSGVVIYIKKKLNGRICETKSTVVDDVFECVTIEFGINRNKTALVSCVYRCHGSNLICFSDTIEHLFNHVRNKDTLFLCGDFNIDLLKCDSHSGTKQFIDLMYGLGFYPLIKRPGKITTTSVIDNIFTSEPECKIDSGLLVNDISDHLPTFALCKCNVKNNVSNFSNKYVRHISIENINTLKIYLTKHSWNTVVNNEDANLAYDHFLHTFMKMYNKHCPLK